MMKFLTVFFVLLYGWRIFRQQSTIRKGQKIFVGHRSKEMNDVLKKKLNEGDGDTVLMVIMTIWAFIVMVIEAFYMLFALSYGNIKIVGVYIIFWLLMLIKGLIKSKIVNRRNDIITDSVTRFKISGCIQAIIDFTFYIYMLITIFNIL